MINPAAMMGLDNAPAYKELKEIKFGIRKLFEIKIKDTKDIERENKRQKEQDKRDAQDVQRVLKNDKALMQGWGTSLENSQAGLMAALLGGAALFGAASMLAGFDLQEFIDDVSNNISRFLDNVLPSSPSMNEDYVPVDGEVGSPGTDDTEDIGDLSDMSPTDDPKAEKTAKTLPLPKTVVVTSKAGMRSGRVHAGVDIGGAGGEPLTVSRPSKIVESRSISGYGNTVIFKDNRGEHLYAHMRALSKFKVGDTVQPGQIIGYLGNTGRSSGPHLHWEFDKRSNVVGRPRSLAEMTDPLSVGGMNWKTPFTGKQKGGVIGKAIHLIKDHESIASLTKGERDWTRPGMQTSTGSAKKPYRKLTDKTPIYPYRDRGSKKTPTIGWGTTFLGGMMSGKNPVTMKTPPMPKKRADEHLVKDVSQLAAHLAKTVKPWKKMSNDQKTGMISIGYNAGPNAHLTKDPKFKPYGDAIQTGNFEKAISPKIMPDFDSLKDRRMEEIQFLKKGPKQVTGFQSGGRVNMSPTQSVPDDYQHYTPEFYARQAKNITQSSIIIINKTSSAPQSVSAPSVKPRFMGDTDTDMPSYSDIAQSYYRYVGGIKI